MLRLGLVCALALSLAEAQHIVPGNVPQVSGLSPSSGAVGTTVTISGRSLGATQGTSSIVVNGSPATITSWTSTSVVVTVPAGATTGPVLVTVLGAVLNAGTFTVTTSSACAGATTYSTAFPATENPISESGCWGMGGASVGLDWSNVQTASNQAYSAMIGSGGVNDAIGLLTGSAIGADQYGEVTIFKNAGAIDDLFPEVEIRLRSTTTAHSSTGYECIVSLKTAAGGTYAGIVRWNGAFNDFTSIGPAASPPTITTGDVLRCDAVGSSIVESVNGTVIATATDATYASGYVGIGFDRASGSAADNSSFGVTYFRAGTSSASLTCSTTLTAGQMANATALQNAILSATSGQTICLPSGTFTWTTFVDIFDSVTPGFHTIAPNVTVKGNTTCASATGVASGLSCTDNTILIDNVDRSSTDHALIGLANVIPTTGLFRLTGITFRMPTGGSPFPCSPYCSGNGIVRLSSPGTTPSEARLDNLHFDHVGFQNWITSNLQGVNDHSVYDMNAGADNSTRPFHFDPGNDTWNTAVSFGQEANWFYVEFNKFTNGIMNDCLSAGTQVYRYNYTTNSAYQQHGTGHAGDNRGCRAAEVYKNDFNSGTGSHTAYATNYGGPMLFWGNSSDGAGFDDILQLHVTRRSNGTYSQSPTPGGWGYCGTSSGLPGAGSNWDQNANVSTGRLCLDQPGRGYGDLLTGTLGASNKVDSATGTIAWPHQSIEPTYEWLNTGTPTNNWVNDSDAVLIANQDYFVGHNNTNCSAGAAACTAGVGSGTRAQRPAQCTANAGTAGLDGRTPGVAWWATDAGGNWDTTHGGANDGCLDVCTATNTWTACYYTPLTYPHPVVR